MKTLPLIALLAVAATVQAAPALQPSDLSEKTLTSIATERQKASIDKYNKAVARAEKERAKAMKDAQKTAGFVLKISPIVISFVIFAI